MPQFLADDLPRLCPASGDGTICRQMGEHGVARARSLAGRTLPHRPVAAGAAGHFQKKMLVQTLRDMEMRGLLARHVYTVVPPKVEYELTALGRTFAGAVEMLYRWGQEHAAALDELEANGKHQQVPAQLSSAS